MTPEQKRKLEENTYRVARWLPARALPAVGDALKGAHKLIQSAKRGVEDGFREREKQERSHR